MTIQQRTLEFEEEYLDPYVIVSTDFTLPENFPYKIRWIMQVPGVILAGGAVRKYFDDSELDDYDIFFTKPESVELVERYLISNGFQETFRCPAGELTNYKYNKTFVQLITPMFYRDVVHLLQEFDITASQFAIELNQEGQATLSYGARSMIDTQLREIRFNRLYYPEATLGRIIKYSQKGYQLKGLGKVEFMARLAEGDPRLPERLYLD